MLFLPWEEAPGCPFCSKQMSCCLDHGAVSRQTCARTIRVVVRGIALKQEVSYKQLHDSLQFTCSNSFVADYYFLNVLAHSAVIRILGNSQNGANHKILLKTRMVVQIEQNVFLPLQELYQKCQEVPHQFHQ